MRKILVPIADSKSAQVALKLGAQLSEALGAGLTVLHVTPSPSKEFLGGGLAAGKLAEWGIELPHFKLLHQAQETLKSHGLLQLDPGGQPIEKHALKHSAQGLYEVHLTGTQGQDVRFRLREGDAVNEILQEAEDPSYDLIITGTRGHRGFKRFWVGSVAQEVALHAPCSILVAKNLNFSQGILVGVSGLATALEAVLQAAQLALALGTPLTLLAVAQQESERPEAERHLAEALASLRSRDLQVQSRVYLGDPARALIAEAGENHLIVLGRTRLAKVKQLLLGEVSLRVLDHYVGPVLLTRDPRPSMASAPDQSERRSVGP